MKADAMYRHDNDPHGEMLQPLCIDHGRGYWLTTEPVPNGETCIECFIESHDSTYPNEGGQDMKKGAYAAIRKAEDGHEFILDNEVRCIRELVECAVAESEQLIPGWHKANPMQRIVPVTITEDKE